MVSGEKEKEEKEEKEGDGGRRQRDGKRGTERLERSGERRWKDTREWLGYINKSEGLSPSSP